MVQNTAQNYATALTATSKIVIVSIDDKSGTAAADLVAHLVGVDLASVVTYTVVDAYEIFAALAAAIFENAAALAAAIP